MLRAARLSLDLGGPARAGLASLYPTVLFATFMDLSDALMVLLVVGFVALVQRGRFGSAVLAAVLAALTKESSSWWPSPVWPSSRPACPGGSASPPWRRRRGRRGVERLLPMAARLGDRHA